MSNKAFVILILFVTLVGGGVFFFMQNKQDGDVVDLATSNLPLNDNPAGENSDQMANEPGDESENQEDDAMELPNSSGEYISYNTANYEKSADNKRVLFFHANWCPTCKAADAEFNKNLTDIPKGVTLLKTDYDNEDDLKEKYDVTYQHTFVQVDENGDEITKWNGGGIKELSANIK